MTRGVQPVVASPHCRVRKTAIIFRNTQLMQAIIHEIKTHRPCPARAILACEPIGNYWCLEIGAGDPTSIAISAATAMFIP